MNMKMPVLCRQSPRLSPLGELSPNVTVRALSAPAGRLSQGERQERLRCRCANFEFAKQIRAVQCVACVPGSPFGRAVGVAD